MDADARRRQPHPACAKRVARARRDRLLALRPRRVRRIPPRVLPLDDDREAAERRRILLLTGRHRKEATESHPAVEEQAVRVAPDHDDGAERAARHLRLDRLCGQPQLRPRDRAERRADVADRLTLVELAAGALRREPRAEVTKREPRVERRAIETVRQLRDEVRDRAGDDADTERDLLVRLCGYTPVAHRDVAVVLVDLSSFDVPVLQFRLIRTGKIRRRDHHVSDALPVEIVSHEPV